mmetsp:Transcript_231/g.459  ORF Transcript_231/g.459 Transcript_231/m.459 type:complete len:205 (+) Transcript_231:63-677(+)
MAPGRRAPARGTGPQTAGGPPSGSRPRPRERSQACRRCWRKSGGSARRRQAPASPRRARRQTARWPRSGLPCPLAGKPSASSAAPGQSGQAPACPCLVRRKQPLLETASSRPATRTGAATGAPRALILSAALRRISNIWHDTYLACRRLMRTPYLQSNQICSACKTVVSTSRNPQAWLCCGLQPDQRAQEKSCFSAASPRLQCS